MLKAQRGEGGETSGNSTLGVGSCDVSCSQITDRFLPYHNSPTDLVVQGHGVDLQTHTAWPYSGGSVKQKPLVRVSRRETCLCWFVILHWFVLDLSFNWCKGT